MVKRQQERRLPQPAKLEILALEVQEIKQVLKEVVELMRFVDVEDSNLQHLSEFDFKLSDIEDAVSKWESLK